VTLWGVPALRLAELVRTGKASPLEVVRAHLDRIAAVDPVLTTFQALRAEGAEQDAKALGARLDLPELPLAGVPVTVKDNVDVAGLPTRLGSRATSEQPAAADDELVRRLRAAGCVVLGKATMPELAIWAHTESALAGVTRNPWRLELTPGGSSGGAAAAVAAGMASLALASDGGGSIRIPSAMCGVFGLKPGPAVVPLPGGAVEHWYGLSAFGPIATSVPDAAAFLDVLTEPGAPATPLEQPRTRLRIAASTQSPLRGVGARAELRQAVEATGRLLAEAGHLVDPADPPYPISLGLHWTRNWLAGIASDAAPLPPDRLEPVTRRMHALGNRLGPDRHTARRWRDAMVRWFGGRDLLLMPVIARRLPAAGWLRRGFAATYIRQSRAAPFTQAWNLAGLPAASVPAGLDSEDLPLSVQLVGPPGSERRLLEVAFEIETARPWPRLAPLRGSR
jgi:amidase